MAGPALIIAAPAAGLSLAAKRRAENRRKQAASNKYSQKYPLTEDSASISANISAAKAELAKIRRTPANTAGAKRVKQREDITLSKWISTMEAQRTDLKSGLNLASTVVTGAPEPQAPAIASVSAPRLPIMDEAAQSPVASVQTGVSAINAQESSDTGQPVAAADGKKTNWILIAGVAVGVLLLLNFMKKN